jgi:hypothetical protein
LYHCIKFEVDIFCGLGNIEKKAFSRIKNGMITITKQLDKKTEQKQPKSPRKNHTPKKTRKN